MSLLDKRRWQSPESWIGLLVLVNLGVGALLLTHYGESWDEYTMYFYARNSLRAYLAFLFGKSHFPYRFDPLIQWHGIWPWMLMIVLHHPFRAMPLPWFSHGLAWVFFQIALVSLFFLAKRYLRPWTAFWVALLFETQPLLWGHGFINLKDTSLMAMALLSVLFGLRLVDQRAWENVSPVAPLKTHFAPCLESPRRLLFWSMGAVLGALFPLYTCRRRLFACFGALVYR